MAVKPIHRRKGRFDVRKESGSGSFAARDSRGSFRDTAKAISQIKSGIPVKVFFALKGQLNISAENLRTLLVLLPGRSSVASRWAGCKKRNRSASFDCSDYLIRR
jgi:hypothetical protein